MRLLIVAAVAAVAMVRVMKRVDGPWRGEDGTVRTAIAGAVAGLLSASVARKLRKES